MNQTEFQEHMTNRKIDFKFIAPSAPWMGAWEPLIKSTKRAIFTVLKKADFTEQMFYSAMVGAENIINSRPLGYQSADPNEQRVLTPNMFLHGRMEGFQMPANIDRLDFDPRKRWRLVQQALSHIWKRFIREILPTLGPRQKWFRDNRNYQVNDEVLIMDKNMPRYKWNIARVVQVYPGRDSVVRIVDLKTENGDVLQKAVHRLIPLT